MTDEQRAAPAHDGATPSGRGGLCRWLPGGTTMVMLASMLAYAVMATGCVSTAGIAPRTVPLAAQEAGLAAAPGAEAAVAPRWWTAFGDARLDALVERALERSPNLALAQSRIERAAAQSATARAADGPRVDAAVDATRQRLTEHGLVPPPYAGAHVDSASVQLNASWELDFFGRHRAALDAALGAERAAAADAQAARLLLASNVVRGWFQLARLVEQREVASRALAQRGEVLGLIRQRVGAGLDSRVELRRGEGALPEAAQQVEALDEQIVLARHALAVLSAQPPGALDGLSPRLDAVQAAALPATLGAGLLARRPDVEAARQRVEAAAGEVAAAKAATYPGVNLAGFVGLSAIGLDRLFDLGSRQYGAGPALRLPILDAGRLRAGVRGRTADLDAAVASYNQTLLDAVRDAADQIASVQSIERQRRLQAERAGERRGRLRLRPAALPRRPRHLPRRPRRRERRARAAPPRRRPEGARARRPRRPGALARRRLRGAAGRSAATLRNRHMNDDRTSPASAPVASTAPAAAPAPASAAVAPAPAAVPAAPAAAVPAAPSAAAAAPPAGAAAPAAPAGNPRRRKALGAVAAVVAVAGVAYGVTHYVVGARYEETDNAYVQGDLVQITPQVGGTVLAIEADDTDLVRAGQPLVRLDPADAQVALDQAEAQLAQAVREVRTTFAADATLQAQVALRQADAARLQGDMARAQDDVARRRPLVATGAVGREEFEHAEAQLAAARSAQAAAQSAVTAARDQLAANRTLTEGTSVEQHPNVQRAAARVREAWLALRRVDVPAPVDGQVARRSVQLGQRVQAGMPLMALVPLDRLWVDANFKEGQLGRLRIGQPATLVADVYGRKVEYHGRVAGLGAGTGAAFSLLPAQNATGNWIKVVQRVPVRVELDAGELAAHPLRIGLSMDVKVDVRGEGEGRPLADAPRGGRPGARTAVYGADDRGAEQAVQRIVAAHLGRAPAAAPRRAGTPAAATAGPPQAGAGEGVGGASGGAHNAAARGAAGDGMVAGPAAASREGAAR